MAKPFLSLILPVSDAAEELPLALIEIDKVFSEAEFSYEIIIVDDGSKDATAQIARSFADAIKYAKVIDNTGQRGIGTAMVVGMLAARGNWRVLIPYPLGVPYEELCERAMHRQADSETAIFIGTEKKTFGKNIGSILFGIYSNLVFRFRIPDPLPTALSFSDDAANQVFGELKTKSISLLIESLFIAHSMGYRVRQEIFKHGGPARVSKSYYLQMLYETIKIRWWLFRKQYNL